MDLPPGENDSESSRMSSLRNYQTPKSSNSGSSFLKIRSPFASLFSFRKSKHEVKLPAPNQRSNIFSTLNRPPPNTEPVKKKFDIYNTKSVKEIASFFEGHPKKEKQNIPSDAQLQREAFQVLGDLDQKLEQEQSYSNPARTSISSTYKPGNIYRLHHNTSDSRKEYSTLSSNDGRRTSPLGEIHTTHATYQPRRFYEMYSVRHHSASESESENTDAKSSSSDSRSRLPGFSRISGRFSSSSLDLPSENLESERTRHHKPKRIPITSIRWNKPSASTQPEVPGRPFRTQSALDLTNCGNTSPPNRISGLYNYSSNKVLSSGTNVIYPEGLTCKTSPKSSTGYYKRDSCGFRPVTKFPTQTNSLWEEENKENSLFTSQPPCSAETKTDKHTEPMEVLSEYPEHLFSKPNKSDPHALNLQTAKLGRSAVNIQSCSESLDVDHLEIPMNFTMTSEIENKTVENDQTSPSGLSESEPMDVDIPNASFPSTEKFSFTAKDLPIVGNCDQRDPYLPNLQTPTGPLFTNQDKAAFPFQSSKPSGKPHYTNRAYSPFTNMFTSSNPIDGSDATSKNTYTDIAERLLMMNLRPGRTENRSDTLKHQKRNASSLPDLIDEKNYQRSYSDDRSLTSKNEEESLGSFLSPVYNTSTSAKPHKMCSENNSLSQNFTSQKEDSELITLDSCSFDPASDRAKEKVQNIPLLERVSFLTDTEAVIGQDGKVLNLPKTAPSYLPKRYQSMYRNNHPADTNNNSSIPKTVQTPEESSEVDGANHVFMDLKKVRYNKEKVKTPEYGLFSKSPLFINENKDTSVTNQQNIHRGAQNVETENGIYHDLNPQWTNRNTEIIEQPRIQSITVIPTSQIVDEHLQSKSCTKDEPEKKPLNLLKEHLLLAPKPYKKSVQEDAKPQFSGDRLTPNIYTCESLSDKIESVETVTEIQQTSKAYTQKITERTQIYERCYTDSSNPDVKTVEYHKVVSVYYTLPRQYFKRLLDVSQNNLKNIDQTLENRQAPSVLLEKIMNKCPEAEEHFGDQNMEKTSPSHCTSNNVSTKELDLGETPLSQRHLLNYNLIPLQTNLINKNKTPYLGAEKTSPDFDLMDQFNSLHISQSGCGHRGNDLPMQGNINDSSPTRTSPGYAQNTYYTLPNRKSNLHDLERSILDNDVTMARNRYNLYSKRGNSFPPTSETQDVFLSPTFGNENIYDTGGCNATDFQDRQVNNEHHSGKKDGLCKEDSFGDEAIYREDIPSLYESKRLKDLHRHQSHHTIDTSPGMETKLSPQSHSQPNTATVNEPSNRIRPSYTSEFVQKKMKPIHARKFTFSFDNTGQRENSNSQSSEFAGQSDADSPSVFYSPKENNLSHVSKHYGCRSSAEFIDSEPSNIYRSKSLKNINDDCHEEEVEIRRKSDGNFSSKSYGGKMKGRSPLSVNYGDNTHNRRYSAEMIDENDNWPDSSRGHGHTPVFTAKAVDYGIFGKEQQEALLNNVKKSLTEGRLWRPSLLKNPNSLRLEEQCTSQESHQTGCKPDDGLKGTLNIYEDEVPPCPESDTDTTTDDEYYLDENDKESEL